MRSPDCRLKTASAASPTASAASPRLLVIPGLDGDPGLLVSAAPALFEGFRPIWFDHRLDDVSGGVDGLAERALAMLDADDEGDAPAYVCGESFGSTVALTLAHRYSDRVRGLVLLSAFGWYPRLPAWSARLGLLLWRVLGDRLTRRILEVWRPLGLPGALGLGCPKDIRQAYLTQQVVHLPGYRGKCEIAIAFDARPWLSSIACPAFVLVGTWDPVVPTRAGVHLAKHMPNAHLVRLPGSHLVHVRRAGQVGGLLKDWLRKTQTYAEAA
jgi:pimeloyl-ACP methyl ester carboxylesterase